MKGGREALTVLASEVASSSIIKWGIVDLSLFIVFSRQSLLDHAHEDGSIHASDVLETFHLVRCMYIYYVYNFIMSSV